MNNINHNKILENLFGNYELISLGYNCTIKRIISELFLIKAENNFFDYIGSTVWAINELLENNFANLFNKENYKNIQIYISQQNYYLTNIQYYLIFLHELDVNTVSFDNFFSRYLRKKERFYKILNSKKKFIFIRLEEPNDDLIIHKEYTDKFNVSEIEHLKKFSKIIKNKFEIKSFLIIYLTKTFQDNYDSENKILYINLDIYNDFNWDNCVEHAKNLFINKYDYIKNILKQHFN